MTDDRGSGTILGLVMAALLIVCGTVCWALVALTTAHQRTAVAADLVALAAAQAGCEAAQSVAHANAARLDDCGFDGEDALVTVWVSGPRMIGPLDLALPRLSASSRAGPR